MTDNNGTDENDPNVEDEPERTPAVIAYVTDGGFQVVIDGDLNPMHLAGIAWYLEKQAERGLAILLGMKQQEKGPGLVVPQGFTRDHLKRVD